MNNSGISTGRQAESQAWGGMDADKTKCWLALVYLYIQVTFSRYFLYLFPQHTYSLITDVAYTLIIAGLYYSKQTESELTTYMDKHY